MNRSALIIFAIVMSPSSKEDNKWISRCLDLAKRGLGYVSPNPPVGAVLIHNDRIIGEGYHSFFGGPHAEVETFQSVGAGDKHLIPQSVLYVSLEPCCIHGKTPPCTDLILREGVQDVRISTVDPNPKISGKGIEILKSRSLKVRTGIMEDAGKDLIRMFRTNVLFNRPYVILKWAQSEKLYIGQNGQRIMISHPYTTTWSHTLRSTIDAIIVGARTIMNDNPQLTTRDAPGRSPNRAVYDPNAKLTKEYSVFNQDGCLVFYYSVPENQNIEGNNIIKYQLKDDRSHANQILAHLYSHQIGILLVEGGTHLLSLFIEENLWDEGWVIQTKHPLEIGIKAPVIQGKLIQKFESATDTIICVANQKSMETG